LIYNLLIDAFMLNQKLNNYKFIIINYRLN